MWPNAVSPLSSYSPVPEWAGGVEATTRERGSHGASEAPPSSSPRETLENPAPFSPAAPAAPSPIVSFEVGPVKHTPLKVLFFLSFLSKLPLLSGGMSSWRSLTIFVAAMVTFYLQHAAHEEEERLRRKAKHALNKEEYAAEEVESDEERLGHRRLAIGALYGTGLLALVLTLNPLVLVMRQVLSLDAGFAVAGGVVSFPVGVFGYALGFVFETAGLLLLILMHWSWFQALHPQWVSAGERVLIALVPLAAFPSLTSALMMVLSAALAPQPPSPAVVSFCVLGVAMALQYYFYTPVDSSFLRVQRTVDPPPVSVSLGASSGVNEEGPRSSVEVVAQQVNERLECRWCTALFLMVMPPTVFVSMTLEMTKRGVEAGGRGLPALESAITVVLLLLTAALYTCMTASKSLWFFAPKPVQGGKESTPLRDEMEEGLLFSPLLYNPVVLEATVNRFRVFLTRFLVAGLMLPCGLYYIFVYTSFPYLFTGLPTPWNGIALVVALYIFALVALETSLYLLQHPDEPEETAFEVKKEEPARGSTKRLSAATSFKAKPTPFFLRPYIIPFVPLNAMLLMCFASLLLCLVLSVDPIGCFSVIFGVISFFMYLEEQEMSEWCAFTVSMFLLLVVWMANLYLFIVSDQKVYGEAMRVSTVALSLGVISSGVLGLLSVGYAFQGAISLLACMTLHVLQLSWTEYVLYARVPDFTGGMDGEEGSAYSAVTVLLTSVVGVATALQLYRHGILPGQYASYVGALYVTKFIYFIVVQCAMAFVEETASASWLIVMELKLCWWAALVMAFTFLQLEQARRKVRLLREQEKSKGQHQALGGEAGPDAWMGERVVRFYCILYACSAFVFCLSTTRNLQRGAFLWITQQPYLTMEDYLTAAPGVLLCSFFLFCYPFFVRHAQFFSFLRTSRKWSHTLVLTGLAGVVLLIWKPSNSQVSAAEGRNMMVDRLAIALGVLTLLGIRLWMFLAEERSRRRWSLVRKIVGWFAVSALMGFGSALSLCTTEYCTFSSLLLLPGAGLTVSLWCAMLVVDRIHYSHGDEVEGGMRRKEHHSDTWVYACLAGMEGSLLFTAVLLVPLLEGDQHKLSVSVLSFGAALNLFVVVVFQCWVHGFSLFPLKNAPASTEQQEVPATIQHVCMVACRIFIFTLACLAFWSGECASPASQCVMMGPLWWLQPVYDARKETKAILQEEKAKKKSGSPMNQRILNWWVFGLWCCIGSGCWSSCSSGRDDVHRVRCLVGCSIEAMLRVGLTVPAQLSMLCLGPQRFKIARSRRLLIHWITTVLAAVGLLLLQPSKSRSGEGLLVEGCLWLSTICLGVEGYRVIQCGLEQRSGRKKSTSLR